ncbi:MAG TPA: hypothetical protein VNZ86_13635 [Bacteroidia bacterium]|jgi:hypothetical protein|nr:hypothetical protein [Bacteroidia bacterium]
MAVSVTDVVAAQIERVRQKLQPIFESSSEVSSMIKKAGGDKVDISRYLYRIPLQQFRGGNFHKYTADGGSLGVGTGMLITSLQAGYITTVRSYRVTDEESDTSATTAQSVVNVFNKTLADAMTESQIDDDITLHTDGTGILTNQSSAATSTTITFAGSTDTLGVNRLREGMCVDVWNAGGTTKRAPSSGTAPTFITAIDYIGLVVTLSQSIASITATDILAFPNLDIYGPSTLTSFSSTWPGGGLTNGPGLTGDSFRHGLYYANDANGSNYYLGKLKSTIPQLLASHISASGATFSFGLVLEGLDQLQQRRDKTITNGLRGIAHMKQREAVFQIGVNISNIFLKPGDSQGKMPDLMPNNIDYTDVFYLCGIPTMVSKRQFQDRIDFINPTIWGRAQTHDVRFKTVTGRNVFEVRNSDGTIAASREFHIEQAFDFVDYDPGAGFYVDSLKVPS